MSFRLISRGFIVAAAFALALPVVASAQTSRVEGMTLQGDYLKDYSNIYSYPSQLSNVGSLVYGELGTTITNPNAKPTGSPETLDRSVGVVLSNLWDGQWGTWAINMSEETPQLGQGDALGQSAPGDYGTDPNRNQNQSFDVMWGKKFGTSSLGLRVNRSFYQAEDQVPGITTRLELDPNGPGARGDNLSRNIIGLGGGLGFEMNPRTNAEFALLYQSRTFENSVSAPVNKQEDDGPSTYVFSARMMWEYQPNWMIMPVFKWYSYDLSAKSTVGATVNSFDNSLKGWQVGASSNWTLGANDLLVVGVTVAQNQVEQEQLLFAAPTYPGGGVGVAHAFNGGLATKITETFAPQVFAALETHVNNWLTLRFGANKGAFHTVKAEGLSTLAGNPPLTQEVSDSPFEMRIGAGVKLGTLQLDAILNDIYPHTLGWLGSGLPGVYFPKVTATYAF
ncbi:MAG: hypothetical protein A2V63_11275 [Candidatus Eisenbacteria bacterium RBG_19FT_COMBO_70_11]|nr:MAG: hypothetical protein A2V63_11275 [Candidatus Eisenbacteria bacterium RBG_19FT_COMBO_70_11]